MAGQLLELTALPAVLSGCVLDVARTWMTCSVGPLNCFISQPQYINVLSAYVQLVAIAHMQVHVIMQPSSLQKDTFMSRPRAAQLQGWNSCKAGIHDMWRPSGTRQKHFLGNVSYLIFSTLKTVGSKHLSQITCRFGVCKACLLMTHSMAAPCK